MNGSVVRYLSLPQGQVLSRIEGGEEK